MRKPTHALGVLACLVALSTAALACGGDDDSTGTTAPNSATVQMVDDQFNPTTVRIAQGGTVTWTNAGSNSHTSTSDTGLWNSQTVSPGKAFQQTFTQKGTFPYHCNFHSNMKGTVVVE